MMKVSTNVVPWWGQAAILLVGMAGTIVLEYLRTVRELEDAGSYQDNDEDERTVEAKPTKARRRSKQSS